MTATATVPAPLALLPSPAADRAPEVEIVVPVFNEERVLAVNVGRLHRHLTEAFPFSWRIVVADNASTDATPEIARRLARELTGVEVLRLEGKGRGRALRAAWSASTADVVGYMDVDISTDLRALLPLVAPLVSGHSEVAIGTRLGRGARVVRGPKRELISRAYNRIVRAALHTRFTDAQCGFKAVRRDALGQLLPEVRDEGWFFDTELLVLAERRGMRVHEVPVDWVDDPDSRVHIVSTALADLRGVARLVSTRPVVRFMGIGVVSTAAYAAIFLLLRSFMAVAPANALALGITAVANTAANRRLTFGVRGRAGLVRHHLQGFLVYALSLLTTNGALVLLRALVSSPPRGVELAVLVIGSVGATVARYVALRTWVFARRRQSPPVVGA